MCVCINVQWNPNFAYAGLLSGKVSIQIENVMRTRGMRAEQDHYKAFRSIEGTVVGLYSKI